MSEKGLLSWKKRNQTVLYWNEFTGFISESYINKKYDLEFAYPLSIFGSNFTSDPLLKSGEVDSIDAVTAATDAMKIKQCSQSII